jgi:hypothetical protein
MRHASDDLAVIQSIHIQVVQLLGLALAYALLLLYLPFVGLRVTAEVAVATRSRKSRCGREAPRGPEWLLRQICL